MRTFLVFTLLATLAIAVSALETAIHNGLFR